MLEIPPVTMLIEPLFPPPSPGLGVKPAVDGGPVVAPLFGEE